MFIGKSNDNGWPVARLIMLKIALIVTAVLSAAPSTQAQSSNDDSIKIYTDTYRPYVTPAGEVDGTAMRLVRLVVLNMDRRPHFEHIDYGYGYYATRKSDGVLSFPWLKTPKREKEVLYSTELYSSKIQLFYNIRFHPDGLDQKSYKDKTFGRVINYSYGENFDALLNQAESDSKVKTYASDVEAIASLLNGDIDVLPQLNSVLAATLNASFSNQSRLIRSIPNIETLFANYLVAPKTTEGQALINAFNKSYAELLEAGVIDPDTLTAEGSNNLPSDIAQIVASEGFPVIIGVSRTDPDESFAIPPGTRVLVLDWSDRIMAPSNADQLYKTMVDETLVLVLNGPHIGKELRIKNMHITIAQ